MVDDIDFDVEACEQWIAKADENEAEWGHQRVDTLLLAMLEELGELAQAYLEARSEDGDPERMQDELDDLAALCVQFRRQLRRRNGS